MLALAARQQEVDPLERSDREQALGDWLEQHGIADAWMLAATIADAGASVANLEKLPGKVRRGVVAPPNPLPDYGSAAIAVSISGDPK